MKKYSLVLFLCLLAFAGFTQVITVSTSQDSICLGESVDLLASSNAINNFTWSPDLWISDINVANPTVTPLSTTTYRVGGTYVGANLIFNGDFSAGNIGFTTQYLYGPDTQGGPFGDLSIEGTYTVVTDPSTSHPNFAPCADHTTTTGSMMVVNGASVPNTNVWCQTILVQTNADYEFSTWVTTMVLGSPAQLQFSINNNLLGSTFVAPSTTCTWLQFAESWNSGSNTSAEICIVNQNIAQGENDFGLDDIFFAPLESDSSFLTIHVSEMDAQLLSQTAIDCNVISASASVSANGGFEPYSYLWDNGETTAEAIDLSEGNHVVTISDAAGCTANIIVQIETIPDPVIDSIDLVQTTCNFDNGALEIIPEDENGIYQYSIDGQNFQASPVFEELAPGTFTVYIEDTNACTVSQEIIVNPSSEISFEINTPNGTDLCADVEVILEAETFESYTWSTGETSASISLEEDGIYSVIVTDLDNCIGEANIEIESCGTYAIPNAFSPNGDGLNDTFGPILKGGGVEITNFKIFNRWGNLVHNNTMPWDGKYKNKLHPRDVLIYVVQINTPEGLVEEQGDVTLIR